MEAFANTLTSAAHNGVLGSNQSGLRRRGIGAWLIAQLSLREKVKPRLTVVERVTLAPRQFLVMVEAEGQRILVATSPDGSPAFYALDPQTNSQARIRKSRAKGLVA